MNIVISIAFAGLIVFVPNNYTHPSWVTAYLMHDDHHVRGLTIYGTLSANQTLQSQYFDCEEARIIGQVFKVECKLPRKTNIKIEADMASGNSFLPPVPHAETPSGLEDAKQKDWFLHISNISSGIRGIDVSKVQAAAGAEISFPWDDAEACELDGEEVHKFKSIGFKNDAHSSGFRQAVAESVLFHFGVKPGPLKVILSSQIGVDRTEVETINVDCFGLNCLAIGIDNSTPECMQGENPGAHFKRYYEVVNHDAGLEMLPFRVGGDGDCPPPNTKVDEKVLSLSLLGCDLKLLAPTSPRLAKFGTDFIEDALKRGTPPADNFGIFLSSLRKELGEEEANLFAALYARQVLNRVICPPVVASP